MIRIDVVTNNKCLKCGVVEEEMVKVGILPFCLKCSYEEFPQPLRGFTTEHPLYENYRKWLNVYITMRSFKIDN